MIGVVDVGFMLFVNCKQYDSVMGSKAVSFARGLASQKSVIAIPSLLMLSSVVSVLPGRVCAPHADAVVAGAFTGYVSPVELKKLGVSYVLLNHSEHRLPYSVLKETVALCLKQKLKVIICAQTMGEIIRYVSLNPYAVAFEPHELIGKNVSVIEKYPHMIQCIVAVSRRTGVKMFVGAGVHSVADVVGARKLGCDGVLLSHIVVGARNPKKVVRELLG